MLGVAFAACLGDDPVPPVPAPAGSGDHGVAAGDRLGRCFPDGSCKVGLVCKNGEICLPPDEQVADAAIDVHADAASLVPDTGAPDAAVEACVLSAPGEGPSCGPTSCAQQKVCCGRDCEDGTCSGTTPIWSCEREAHCFGGMGCCIYGTSVPPGACSAKLTSAQSRCKGSALDCAPSGGRPLCNTNTDCPSRLCVPHELQAANGFTVVLKVCKIAGDY